MPGLCRQLPAPPPRRLSLGEGGIVRGQCGRYRAVAQEDAWGGGVACVASSPGSELRRGRGQILEAKAPAQGWTGPSVDVLRRILNDGFKDTGLRLRALDQPFIGDPSSLETRRHRFADERALPDARRRRLDGSGRRQGSPALPVRRSSGRWSSPPTTTTEHPQAPCARRTTDELRWLWLWSRSSRRRAAPGRSRNRCARIARRTTIPSVRPAWRPR